MGDAGRCDNKQDILTQSQIFKASDMGQFVTSQAINIESLLKSQAMEVQPIRTLPPTGKLLRAIEEKGHHKALC
jgi:hypothetical protein